MCLKYFVSFVLTSGRHRKCNWKNLLPVRYLKYLTKLYFLQIFYPRDLWNCKWTRHNTFVNYRHLGEDVFNGFHFVNRHFRSSPEGFKHIHLLISLRSFLAVLVSLIIIYTRGKCTRISIFYLVIPFLSVSGPKTKNLVLMKYLSQRKLRFDRFKQSFGEIITQVCRCV